MAKQSIDQLLVTHPDSNASTLELDDGSRVAVIGGGPAGSFFTYFLLSRLRKVL